MGLNVISNFAANVAHRNQTPFLDMAYEEWHNVLSVALDGCGASEVLMLNPPGYDCPAEAVPFADEAALLRALVRRVVELDPDVLTGWNFIDFDLAVLLGAPDGVPRALVPGEGRSFPVAGVVALPERAFHLLP